MLELWRFTVTIPAGTPKASFLTFNLTMPPREVVEIEVLIPPGPRGEVGFKIGQSGGQVFPSSSGDFIVTDNETIHWPIEGANSSGAWQVFAYNTGSKNHSLEFRFQARLPAAQAAALAGASGAATPIDPLAIIPEPAPDAAGAELPPEAIPEPPAEAPPGVATRPGLPPLQGPQAPELPREPGLPAAPAPPPVRVPGTAQAAFDAGEANTQALLEGQAAQANLEALLNELEARDQALHEGALGGQPSASPSPPPAPLII